MRSDPPRGHPATARPSWFRPASRRWPTRRSGHPRSAASWRASPGDLRGCRTTAGSSAPSGAARPRDPLRGTRSTAPRPASAAPGPRRRRSTCQASRPGRGDPVPTGSGRPTRTVRRRCPRPAPSSGTGFVRRGGDPRTRRSPTRWRPHVRCSTDRPARPSGGRGNSRPGSGRHSAVLRCRLRRTTSSTAASSRRCRVGSGRIPSATRRRVSRCRRSWRPDFSPSRGTRLRARRRYRHRPRRPGLGVGTSSTCRSTASSHPSVSSCGSRNQNVSIELCLPTSARSPRQDTDEMLSRLRQRSHPTTCLATGAAADFGPAPSAGAGPRSLLAAGVGVSFFQGGVPCAESRGNQPDRGPARIAGTVVPACGW